MVHRTYHIMLVDWVKEVAIVLVGIVVVEEEHWKVEFQKISSVWLLKNIVFWFRVKV